MGWYFAGVAVSFLIGVWRVLYALTTVFSTRARNLAKIGLHYSVLFGFQQEGSSASGWAFFLIYALALAPLASWLSVGSTMWRVIRSGRKSEPVPSRVKEIQNLIATRPLTKEQLVELQEELQVVTGATGAALTGAPDEDPGFLDLSDGDLISSVEANPKAKLLTISDHWSDGSDWWRSVEEYRFVDGEVQSRLLEESHDSMGRKEWSVKDGVVLENDLRERDANLAIRLAVVDSVDERIAQLKERVSWQPVKRLKLRFFIMAQHPAEFPMRERRRLIRTEIERLEAGARTVRATARELGLLVADEERGVKFRYPEGFLKGDRDRVHTALDAAFIRAGVSSGEIYVLNDLRRDLYQLLGEEVPGDGSGASQAVSGA